MMIKLFVGFDHCEIMGTHVFINSVVDRSSRPVSVTLLDSRSLRTCCGFDVRHKPGSTEFTYSRFLVPWLCHFDGYAIFADGADMLCMDDISKLLDPLPREEFAVSVVQHPPYPAKSKKMWDQPNQYYPRKNWSSLIVWNCGHIGNQILTPEYIMKNDGSHLHQFQWLRDEEIGSVPGRWNVLVGEQRVTRDASLLHYTLGLPPIYPYSDQDAVDLWYNEKGRTTYVKSHSEQA